MTKHYLILFLLFFASVSFSQENKLKTLLGEGFRSIPAVNRGYNDFCGDCELKFTQRRYVDTSGIVYNNEYVLFRNYISDSALPGKSFAYFHEQPVNNAEFREFKSWVRDSMARDRIYAGALFDKEAVKYLTLDPKRAMKKEGEATFKLNDRHYNRELYPLNWNKKFDYNDPELIPLLADLYLPQAERFYRIRAFDDRKPVFDHGELFYDGKSIQSKTTLITYPEVWALGETNRFGETTALAQLYEQQFLEASVLTYSESQATAFCRWRQVQLQNELNKQHLNYTVSVNLPLSTELHGQRKTSITIPTKDYTENWKITAEEYQLFINAVRDSIILEHLYESEPDDERAASLFNHVIYFYSDPYDEMKEFDPSDREECRNISAFKPIDKVYRKFKHQIDSSRACFPNDDLAFRYYIRDPAKMAVVGKTTYNTRLEQNYETFEIDSMGEPVGRTHNQGFYNIFRHQTDALCHNNLARFIHRININILPAIDLEKQNPEDIVQGISYEQALAYYNWKFPISKAGETQNWQDYVFPTKEQFDAIQRGETIVIPEHQLEYPAPIFHYVVQFTPKK